LQVGNYSLAANNPSRSGQRKVTVDMYDPLAPRQQEVSLISRSPLATQQLHP